MTTPAAWQFDKALSEVQQFAADLQTQIAKLIDGVNKWLPWLGPLADKTKAALVWCRDLVVKIGEEIYKLITGPGVPWTLFAHGSDWTDIGTKVAGHANEAATGVVVRDDSWTGDAATAYKASFGLQTDAMKAIKTATDEVHDALRNVGIAIIVFWIALAAALAIYIFELIAAAAATTPPATPAAPVIAGIASTKFIAILAGLVVALGAAFSVMVTQAADLTQRLGDPTFPGQHWPLSATHAFADGSNADGTLGWRFKQA
jgi:uncharacterized protein YukE